MLNAAALHRSQDSAAPPVLKPRPGEFYKWLQASAILLYRAGHAAEGAAVLLRTAVASLLDCVQAVEAGSSAAAGPAPPPHVLRFLQAGLKLVGLAQRQLDGQAAAAAPVFSSRRGVKPMELVRQQASLAVLAKEARVSTTESGQDH
jgi:hypothetical protein